MSKVHGVHNHDNLLHLEHEGEVYHVAVSGDGWNARCVELNIVATGKNQAETLANLVAKVVGYLREVRI